MSQLLGTGNKPAAFIRKSFGAPLDAVRAYFGSKLAFYFCFLNFYTMNLIRPAPCVKGREGTQCLC